MAVSTPLIPSEVQAELMQIVDGFCSGTDLDTDELRNDLENLVEGSLEQEHALRMYEILITHMRRCGQRRFYHIPWADVFREAETIPYTKDDPENDGDDYTPVPRAFREFKRIIGMQLARKHVLATITTEELRRVLSLLEASDEPMAYPFIRMQEAIGDAIITLLLGEKRNW